MNRVETDGIGWRRTERDVGGFTRLLADVILSVNSMPINAGAPVAPNLMS